MIYRRIYTHSIFKESGLVLSSNLSSYGPFVTYSIFYNHTHIFSTAAVPGYLRPYEFCKPVWVWVSHKFNVLCHLQHESIYVILPWQTPSTTLAPSKSTGESSKMSSVKNGRRRGG